jgi:hypothetical protein
MTFAGTPPLISAVISPKGGWGRIHYQVIADHHLMRLFTCITMHGDECAYQFVVEVFYFLLSIKAVPK